MADIRISALPQVTGQRQPVQDRVAAQRQDYGFQAADTGSELQGLVRGLSVLNPALDAYGQQAAQQAAEDARKAGEADANRADMREIAAEDLAGRPLPSSVPPAFGASYREGLKSVLGDRSGVMLKSQMLQEYNEKKDTEGFSFGGFLDDFRARAMGGFVDPLMAAKVGQHINQMEVGLRDNFERVRMERQVEAVDAAFGQVIADRLSPTMTADELHEAYTGQILPEAMRINKSPKDAAALLFSRVVQMSNQVGGAPQMFDVFEKFDAEGMTLAARNPEVAKQVASARAQAKAQLDHNILEGRQVELFKSKASIDDLIRTNPSAVTMEFLADKIGPGNIYATHQEALADYNQAQAALSKDNGLAGIQEAIDGRRAGDLPPDAQRDAMAAMFGPMVTELWKVANSKEPGDNTKVAGIAEDLVKRWTFHGFTEPIPALQRYFERLSVQLPNKDGPSPSFTAAATFYKAMAANPQVRNQYFKEDLSEVMEAYTSSVREGADPLAAYTDAYTTVSPEAKKAAAELAKNPEFIKATAKSIDEALGSSWWPQLLGGNGRPSNADGALADVRIAATAFKRKNPNASADQIKEYASNYMATNYVHDTTSRMLIKVPPQMATKATQEALTSYSKTLVEAYKLESGLPGDWRVQYTPMDKEGSMGVALVNSTGGMQQVGQFKLEQIVGAAQYEKVISHERGSNGEPSEAEVLQEVKSQLRSGKVDPAYMQANRRVIDKARLLRYLPAQDLKAIDKLSRDSTLQKLKEIPSMSFGKPDNAAIMSAPKGRVKVDHKLTASIAQKFALAPYTGPDQGALNMAASLITMGEAVVLQAYPDPAKDAGNNIGSGYNLKANAANARADLKRARVPEDQIEGVLNGTRQLTSDQVMRLTQLAIPRYMEVARKTAEATSPGLWDKMTTQQRAVMTDVAYQVGSVEQFKKAWKAMSDGDAKGFAEHAQTTYVNKAGERVSDTRRNSLRAAMLEGLPSWNATLTKYGALPSNQVDVAALSTK